MKRAVIAAIAFSLGACVTGARLDDTERLALYRQHAGAPIDNFRYFGSLNGWTPLGDSALAVWTRPNRAYLLELGHRCIDLDFATAISVTHQFSTVYARFDKVVPLGGTGPSVPCYIREIRPLDVAALKDAQREMRENAQVAERESR